MRDTTPVEAYVEAWGRYWEAAGGARTQGRLLGYLLVSDPPEQSAADLADALQASRGSISTVTRQLIDLGLVERITYPGDRASYYRIPKGAWLRLMEGEQERIRALSELARDGLVLAPGDGRVEELRVLVDFWLREWPRVLERLRDEMKEG